MAVVTVGGAGGARRLALVGTAVGGRGACGFPGRANGGRANAGIHGVIGGAFLGGRDSSSVGGGAFLLACGSLIVGGGALRFPSGLAIRSGQSGGGGSLGGTIGVIGAAANPPCSGKGGSVGAAVGTSGCTQSDRSAGKGGRDSEESAPTVLVSEPKWKYSGPRAAAGRAACGLALKASGTRNRLRRCLNPYCGRRERRRPVHSHRL